MAVLGELAEMMDFVAKKEVGSPNYTALVSNAKIVKWAHKKTAMVSGVKIARK